MPLQLSSLIGAMRQTMLPTSDLISRRGSSRRQRPTVLGAVKPPPGGIFDIRPHLKKVKM